ncbi:hypothetical protein F4861DRAFT_508237 [Xylaria intraflava]|nr:hypothetical protein F4861DRAFT_508237 [Xylaria intraflava]
MCDESKTSILKFLLEEIRRANPVDSDIVTLSMNDILRHALKSAKVEVISVLFSYGADLDSAIDSGSTPLHQAAIQGNIELCKFLLEKKSSYLNISIPNVHPSLILQKQLTLEGVQSNMTNISSP